MCLSDGLIFDLIENMTTHHNNHSCRKHACSAGTRCFSCRSACCSGDETNARGHCARPRCFGVVARGTAFEQIARHSHQFTPLDRDKAIARTSPMAMPVRYAPTRMVTFVDVVLREGAPLLARRSRASSTTRTRFYYYDIQKQYDQILSIDNRSRNREKERERERHKHLQIIGNRECTKK